MGRNYSRLVKTLILSTAFILTNPINPVAAGVSADQSYLLNSKLTADQIIEVDGKTYVSLDAVKANMIDVKDIIKQVGPSVVGIIGNLKETNNRSLRATGDNTVFGTGVIYKSNGYIITNAHVVKDMENIVVVLSNGKAYKAKLKISDEKTDLAIIKIDKGGLTPARFGSISNTEVGDRVIAIGTPMSFSLRNSATTGIISGINRAIKSEYAFIQSDAAINGGNSGGPLVNTKGEVIGINTVKISGVGVEGLSFSIPVDTVEYVIDHYEKYGKVKRPYLGVEFLEGIAARYGLPSSEGLTVTKISDNSPASKAKLEVEDIILEVNGVKLVNKIDFNEEMKKYLPGDTAELLVEHQGEKVKITITFEEEK